MSDSLLRRLRTAASKTTRKIRVWGIDLGTTNSTVTEISTDLIPMPLEIEQKTEQGSYTGPVIPSIVAIRGDGIWVGEGAKRMRNGSASARGIEGKTLFSESKNDMGLRKTYADGPPTIRHAREAARTILRFIRDEASEQTGGIADRVVVTVPASFLANQRLDTLWAAKHAGIDLADHELLDEPTAALLDYAIAEDLVLEDGQSLKTLLFDFGGGTCDISIVELINEGGVHGRVLATSRYHRLGGGDIDRAIVHEVLIPALALEQKINLSDLSWAEKKRVLEPQLLGTAEQLKIALCRDIRRHAGFGRYDNAVKEEIFAQQPAVETKIGSKRMVLTEPRLDSGQWEELLAKFLSEDELYVTESEYRTTQSVFSPIKDALMRAGLEPKEIDLLLLAGGSSMIPQVQWRLSKYFTKAKSHSYHAPVDAQLAISRGAAWHALGLELLGEPLITPCAGDGISLLTGQGTYLELVSAGSLLPFPAEGWAEYENLVVPTADAKEILMKVVTSRDKQTVFSELWQLGSPAKLGERLLLKYKLTGNGEFVLRASLAADPDEEFERSISNPLVQSHNPNIVRVKIEEVEEQLRQHVLSADDSYTLADLAKWYSELGQNEKALEYLKRAQVLWGSPNVYLLNLQAITYAKLGDIEKAVAFYDKCFEVSDWLTAKANAAIDLFKAKQYGRALSYADQVIDDSELGGPASVVRWRCLRALKRKDDATNALANIPDAFGSVEELGDWELGWYESFANETGDKALLKSIKDARFALQGQTQNGDGTGAKAPMVSL